MRYFCKLIGFGRQGGQGYEPKKPEVGGDAYCIGIDQLVSNIDGSYVSTETFKKTWYAIGQSV